MSGSVHDQGGAMPLGAAVSGARARRAALAAALGLVLGCSGGCAAGGAGKADLGTRSSAERATRAGDWKVAAERWYSVFRDSGYTEVRPCVEASRAMIRLGDPESASSVVKLGLEHNPGNSKLLEMEAEALVASGFRRSAERSYEKALAGDPDCADCLLGLARQRMALGKESLAVRPLEQLIALDAGGYEVLSLLARARTAAGDLAAAFDAWRAAFQLDEPGRPLSRARLVDRLDAAMLVMEPEVPAADPRAAETAGNWLKRVVEEDPQSTRAHFELGLLYERGDRLDFAEGSYVRAVETDPSCLMALTNLALLYSKQGDAARTRAIVDRALALETNAGRRRALEQLVEDCERPAQDDGGR